MLSPGRVRQLWYAPLLAIAMGLMMLRFVILARILSLQEFAQFSGGVLVASTFCMLGCLGLQSTLQRQWPVELMRGQERRGLALAAQCNVVALICAGVGLLISASNLSFAALTPPLLAVGIVLGLSQQVFLISTVESRSRGDALRYAWENVARSTAALAFGTALAFATRSALWVLAVEAAISIVLAIALFRGSVRRAHLQVCSVYGLALRQLGRVNWRSALMLMSIGTIGFLTLNADRWVAAAVFDANNFGTYSFAWIVLMIAQASQALLNASAYPMVARRFARDGRKGAFRLCIKLSLGLLGAGILCVVPLWLIVDWGVRRWFAAYAAAIDILPPFFAVAVLRTSDFWSSYLVIIGQEKRLLAVSAATAAVGLIAWFAAVRPWLGTTQLREVALLAITLTVLSYVSAATLAWNAKV